MNRLSRLNWLSFGPWKDWKWNCLYIVCSVTMTINSYLHEIPYCKSFSSLTFQDRCSWSLHVILRGDIEDINWFFSLISSHYLILIWCFIFFSYFGFSISLKKKKLVSMYIVLYKLDINIIENKDFSLPYSFFGTNLRQGEWWGVILNIVLIRQTWNERNFNPITIYLREQQYIKMKHFTITLVLVKC